MKSIEYFTVILNLLLVVDGHGLTIDNQLVIIANDCYTRVAIGSKIAQKDVSSSSPAATVSECEDECSRKRNTCEIFSFGISPKGNGTCLTGVRAPDAKDLVKDSDYDVYIRQQSSPDCLPDRVYQLGSGRKPPIRENDADKRAPSFGGGDVPRPGGFSTPRPPGGNRGSDHTYKVFSETIGSSYPNDHRGQDPGRPLGSSRPSGNDVNRPNVDRRPLNDRRPLEETLVPGPGGFGTVAVSRPQASDNRGPDSSKLPERDPQPDDGSSRPFHPANPNAEKPYGHKDYSSYPSYEVTEYTLDSHPGPGYAVGQNRPFFSSHFDADDPDRPYIHATNHRYQPHGYGSQSGGRPVGHDRYDSRYPSNGYPGHFEGEEHSDPGDRNKHRYHGATSGHGVVVFETLGSCYRKLFTGKRITEIHVRRGFNCDRIDDCGKECDDEKNFFCEGFNYRSSGTHGSRGQGGFCELSSVPMSRMDIGRDFSHEPRCDYYERVSGCAHKRPTPGVSSYPNTGWVDLPVRGDSYRPGQGGDNKESYPPDRRPFEPSRPYLPDRRPPHEDRRRPIDPPRPHQPDRRPWVDDQRPSDNGLRPPFDGYFHRRPNEEDTRPPNNRDRFESSYWDGGSDHRPIPPIRIRPIEDDVHFDHPRPERPYIPKYPQRPPTEIGYRPHHDLGSNEIVPYQPDRRKDSQKGWGDKYEGVYGGSYGYNTNYVDEYNAPKRNPHLHHDKRPFEANGIYGPTYHYGGAFGYGDNYIPADRDVIYGGSGYMQQCSIRSGAGFKMRRGIVRKSYLTPNLDHCENLCASEKNYVCRTFGYRYVLAASAPTDNCLLSAVSYRDLDFYDDLEPDRDFDIYSMAGDGKSCGKERPVDVRPPEECFWRVRSGCGIPTDITRGALVVEDLGECEAECVDARDYTCRSFVYRYGPSQRGGSPNCFLSDFPFQEIDPLSLTELDGAELYQRGSFGRGCEPYPFPPLNDRGRKPKPDARPPKKDEMCYAEYQKPCRLTSYAVMLTTNVADEYECRRKCSVMRERDPIPCMSFSFRISAHRDDDNCFMSDVSWRDLRPGVDYIHGDGHILFAWKEFEPQCHAGYSIEILLLDDGGDSNYKNPSYDSGDRRRPGGYNDRPSTWSDRDPSSGSRPYHSHYKPTSGDPSSLGPPGYGNTPEYDDRDYDSDRRPGWTSGGFNPDERPLRPHGGGGAYPGSNVNDHRPSYGGGYRPNAKPVGDDDYHGGHPLNPDRPDPIGPSYGPSGNRPGGSHHGYGTGSGSGSSGGSSGDYDARFNYHHSSGHQDSSYSHGQSAFEHYTVNGYPCKRGTKCERNKIAGFWSCEPEGSEYGSWDYCCEPTHHCGFSQGFHYPWCYVGPSKDQWRPCSEQYYPHLPSPRPGRPSPDRYDDPSNYGEVPKPGLLGRHWPVAYLHREAPPNATDSTDSLAASDDRRYRELNTSGEPHASGRTSKHTNDLQSHDCRNTADLENGSDDSLTTKRHTQPEPETKLSRANVKTGQTLGSSDNGSKLVFRRGQVERILKITETRDPVKSPASDLTEIGKPIRQPESLEHDSGRNRNETSNATDTSWFQNGFVEVPTIPANRTSLKLSDYFEIVDVD